MKIYFITNNIKKVRIAKDILGKYDIEVIQETVETPEIQSLNGKEVSEYSVLYANDKLKKPVVKTDVSYAIEALNGFPGPFVKYINQSLTAEDILAMMQGIVNRRMIITEYLSYCDENKNVTTFHVDIPCTISDKIINNEKGSTFDKITIREGTTIPQNMLSDETIRELFEKQIDVWNQLAEFLKKQIY